MAQFSFAHRRTLLPTLGLGTLLLAACEGGGDNGTVRAERFELVDAEGRVRAEIALRDGEPGIYLDDADGRERLAVFHDADGTGLKISDEAGTTRIGVVQFVHGGGGVALHGPGSQGAAVLYLKEQGSLRFFDGNGTVTNQVLATGAGPAGQASATDEGGAMKPRISMITLGVDDMERSVEFYEKGLGFPRMETPPTVAFFTLNGTWLGLYGREALAEDADVPPEGGSYGGFALAHNVHSEEEVDAVYAQALAAGATPTKQPQKTFWGGYSGYFRDPDGHLWEIAHNPHEWIGPSDD